MEWRATGALTARPALRHPELLAPPVVAALERAEPAGWTEQVGVAEIDPALADTAEFCRRYGVDPASSANCVIVRGKRAGDVRFAACMVLATSRLDVNGVVRRRLDARTASFAPMDEAVALSGMEYGGITPLGLPEGWPILIDAAVHRAGEVVVGSGIRASKLFLPGSALSALPGAEVIEGLATPLG
jgi:prolyl-tRNA editing enzyme YbaK/EbsC (Cys-tRNA(Pro) deacylase)